MKKNLFFLAVFIFCFFIFDSSSLLYAQESIEILTYYPAPYGVYETLRIRGELSRLDSTLYSDTSRNTHINLGVNSTTGTSGQNYQYCTISGGFDNTASHRASTIGGGENNTTSAERATISGGNANTATAPYSAIGGGQNNITSAPAGPLRTHQTVAGGLGNTASNGYATVGGGRYNTASHLDSTISGGRHNEATYRDATIGGGRANTSSSAYTFVGGGFSNIASNAYASVLGGRWNEATDLYTTVSGGWVNRATNDYATIGGGYSHMASGFASTIPGGYNNLASAYCSFAAGWNASATHRNSFVWSSDSSDGVSNGNFSFNVRASGGTYLNGGGWSDIAEYMDILSEEDLSKGEIVSIKEYDRLGKSSKPYDENILGVISSEKTFTLHLGDLNPLYNNTERMPVTLAGKVLVKVNNESGFIALGDPITSSSTPGVGMRAAQIGKIIGYAMERLEKAEGEILVFVNLTYYVPPKEYFEMNNRIKRLEDNMK